MKLSKHRIEMMQDLFVKPALHRQRGPRTSDLAAIASLVTCEPEFEAFDIDLVGSCLDETANPKDIDLAVRWRETRHRSLHDAEVVLSRLRCFGLERGVRVDPTLRTRSEQDCIGRSRQDHKFLGIKLDSPVWVNLRATACCGSIRPVGNFLVALRRPLHDANYYAKLPIDSQGRHYLRPSRPLHAYLQATQ